MLIVRHHYVACHRPHCHWWRFAQAFVSSTCFWRLFLRFYTNSGLNLLAAKIALYIKLRNQNQLNFCFCWCGLAFVWLSLCCLISTQRDIILNVNTIKSFTLALACSIQLICTALCFCLHKLIRFSFFKKTALLICRFTLIALFFFLYLFIFHL